MTSVLAIILYISLMSFGERVLCNAQKNPYKINPGKKTVFKIHLDLFTLKFVQSHN